MTHTPGPWRIHKQGGIRSKHSGVNISWDAIAVNSDEEGAANARLIAAAPKMLEALKFASTDPRFSPVTHKEILEAITEAEGKS